MTTQNPSIAKLEYLAEFLKNSGKFYFINYNIDLFIREIEKDSLIKSVIDTLLSRHDAQKKAAEDYVDKGFIEIGDKRVSLNQYRLDCISSFDEWVAFCYSYAKSIGTNRGIGVITSFSVQLGDKDETDLNQKVQFYYDCIEPIVIYIKTQINFSLNALHILRRYKVLCEWYDREKLLAPKEPQLTRGHLDKYLFDQGFTYSLSETSVPSGRIDNFALSVGKQLTELSSLLDAIVAEGKIYDGKKRPIIKVKEQILKRLNDLHFNEGYCVIYNKKNNWLHLQNTQNIDGIPYIQVDNKHIYFLIINLHDDFYDSTKKMSSVDIDL